MSNSPVWVQLYYADTRRGRPTSVRKPKDVEEKEWNVDALARAVLPKHDPAELAEVFVYPAGTTPTFSPDESLDPGGNVPLGTTSDNPLIVVAPDPQQTHGPLDPPQQEKNSSWVQAFNNLSFEVHRIREALPSVLVGHTISPSEASKKPQAAVTEFDALGLGLAPRNDGSTYRLPDTCGTEWNFSYQWPRDTAADDRILERQSYEPVCNFLKSVSLLCADVSDGQNCVEGLLFNTDIFTCRNENPHLVHGQSVFHRHRVAGRADIAVLKAKPRGPILRHMVKFAIELKTVEGYRQSATGCMRGAQLQLIGLNAFNTRASPPVLLSNLARTHQVVYLAKDEDWNYDIAVQNCATFAAAVHFANEKSEEGCISQHFARPNTPQSSDDSS